MCTKRMDTDWLPSHHSSHQSEDLGVFPSSTWLSSQFNYRCEDLGPSSTWLSSQCNYRCEDLGPSSTWLSSQCDYRCEDLGPSSTWLSSHQSAIDVRTLVHGARVQVGIGCPSITDTDLAMESLLRHRLSTYVVRRILDKFLL